MGAKVIQNADGTIEVISTDEMEKLGTFDMTYEKSEIPMGLIDECNKLDQEKGSTHFIFDSIISNRIKSINASKEDKRDISISEILSERYHIDNGELFKEMPSRISYYDSETRIVDKYKRYDSVIDFIKSIGFIQSEYNLGREYEQSYTLEIFKNDEVVQYYILRVRPNLFINIKDINDNSSDFFFNRGKIISYIEDTSGGVWKSELRNFKLNIILN